jgi:hypothetical protein
MKATPARSGLPREWDKGFSHGFRGQNVVAGIRHRTPVAEAVALRLVNPDRNVSELPHYRTILTSPNFRREKAISALWI